MQRLNNYIFRVPYLPRARAGSKKFLLFLRALLISNIPKGKVFFAIGIDTEQDVDKNYVHTGEYRNVSEGIPRLLDIFDDFNAKSTWLITPDVAQHSGDFFKKLAKKHEIGCHVHPEYFDGFIEGMKMQKILPLFSYEKQVEMLQEASDVIRKNVGVNPRSFRAGRFGINNDTLRALASCGFNLDCSMTPFLDWDFHGTLASSDVSPRFLRVGSSDILEIPVTIVRPFRLFPAWLRPSFFSGSDMINVMKIRARSKEAPLVLNMMFHSMELIDPNPYFTAKRLFDNMRSVLEYASEHCVSFVTMNDLYHRLKPSISFQNQVDQWKNE